MAIYYSIEDGKGLVRQDKEPDSKTPSVEIYTPKEFLTVDLRDDDIEEALSMLSRSQGSHVNLLPDCIIGSLSFPNKKNLLHAPLHFGFYINQMRLILIDSKDEAQKAINSLGDLALLSKVTTARVFFEFMKHFVKDDALFLTDVEKQLSEVEDSIVDHHGNITNHELLLYRRRLLKLDRYYQLLTDMVTVMSKDEYQVLCKNDRRLFRLFGQECERLFQRSEYLKEYSLQLRELYQGQIDIQQNKTIQWLTVVTTLVVPLTLLSSWYGMNFENMPELGWEYSYFVLMGICIVIIIVQLLFFKKRKWL